MMRITEKIQQFDCMSLSLLLKIILVECLILKLNISSIMFTRKLNIKLDTQNEE